MLISDQRHTKSYFYTHRTDQIPGDDLRLAGRGEQIFGLYDLHGLLFLLVLCIIFAPFFLRLLPP